MDTGMGLKPVAVAPTEPARPVVDAARAAPTELPQAKAVAPAAETTPARSDRLPAADQTTREVVLDPASRAVIFRVVDASSGQLKQQVPAEALLRLRAYARAKERAENAGDPHADLTT